ncbi:heterokaryon incompatibility protein-domain-containing protein [Rhexocercosporidium sp. MPI-PUGE-AT-0058]|nr:heterokaryon incompatibility protein-domain-containing protein [Rhexocercosporidium sp. MPI-PUGE-AT-0058]
MDPIFGKAVENRSIMNWASTADPGFWSTTHCILESEVQQIVRSSPVTISVEDGRTICSLCQALDGSVLVGKDSDAKDHRLEYKDYKELDELARQGCLTCRIFRAAILYHHPSNDAAELLALDEDSLSVYLNNEGTAVSISYPFKASREEFEYDREWPLGRPSFMLPLDDEPRQRYKRFNTAIVHVPLAPSHFQLQQIVPNVEQSKSRGTAIEMKREDPEVLDLENFSMAFAEEFASLMGAGDSETMQQSREEAHKVPKDSYGERLSHDGAGQSLIVGTIAPSPTAPDSILGAKAWLRECLGYHTNCGPQHHTATMPKRILDLGVSSDIQSPLKLCLTQEAQVLSYACLSYCWGKEEYNYFSLLRSNITRLMTEILLKDLPKTIRDALWIARSLATRYIWIDALCIIQDDISDWQDQAPCMGDIYYNATFTIAASSSDHADRGLLQSRPAECYELQPCEIFKRLLGRSTPSLYRYLDDAPILRRAWTMQELYLCRRILYVTDAFLAWECRGIQGTELWPFGFPQADEPSPASVSMFPFFQAKEIFRSRAASAEDMHAAWQNLVTDYSSRKMTRQSDILVAIAGLASICKIVDDDEYLAGLWKNNLLSDLLWQSDESRCRSDSYTAPTWSWASTHAKHNPGHPDHRHTSIGFTQRSESAEVIFTVDDANVSYVKSNDKLQANAGFIKLSGKFAEASINEDYNWAVHGGECLMIGVKDWKATGDFTFDTDDMVKIVHAFFGPHRARTTDTQVYCLAMIREEVSAERSYGSRQTLISAMILEKVVGSETYKRVGMASFKIYDGETEAFDECQCKTVLVV